MDIIKMMDANWQYKLFAIRQIRNPKSRLRIYITKLFFYKDQSITI